MTDQPLFLRVPFSITCLPSRYTAVAIRVWPVVAICVWLVTDIRAAQPELRSSHPPASPARSLTGPQEDEILCSPTPRPAP
jgi:hypothetical protein